jgi:ATP-dependent Clp protease, protease subunit
MRLDGVRAEEGEEKEEPKKEEAAFGPVAKSLFRSRQIPVFGAIDDTMAARIVAQLLALEQADAEAPITILLNSPGGSVTDGFAIYDAMRFVKPEIRIVCMGLCASIATIILLGAPKKWRVALPNTRLLIHQVYIPGVIRGQATDLEITARDLLHTRDRLNQLLATETGQPLDRIQRDTNRDYWMTAQEAVEYGPPPPPPAARRGRGPPARPPPGGRGAAPPPGGPPRAAPPATPCATPRCG